MQQCAAHQPAFACATEAEFRRDQVGKERHALAVAAGKGALGVDDLGEAVGDVVEQVFVHGL
ncbi:hypothetical protein D3C86_2243800 [compost metagenome]